MLFHHLWTCDCELPLHNTNAREMSGIYICTGNRLLQHKIYVQKIMYTLLLLLVINFEINILKIYHLKPKKKSWIRFLFLKLEMKCTFCVFCGYPACMCVSEWLHCTHHTETTHSHQTEPPFKLCRIGKRFIPFLCIPRSCFCPWDAMRIGWWDK